MALLPDFQSYVTALADDALQLGIFERVNGHEPKSTGAKGLVCNYWADRIDPVPGRSGLAAGSIRLTMNAQVETSAMQQPFDGIDPLVMNATSALFGKYIGGFTLGGLVEQVDVFGAHGVALSAQAGYVERDRVVLRVMVLKIPLIIDDLYPEAP
jgi:hypothetical protein